MQMMAWFDTGSSSVDFDDPHGQFRPISKNEANAIVKNRIEERKLTSQIKMYNNETRFNCNNIKANKVEAEVSMNAIHLSTGYAFNRPTKSAPAYLYSQSLKSKAVQKFKGSQSAAVYRSDENDAKKQVRFNSSNSDLSTKSSNNSSKSSFSTVSSLSDYEPDKSRNKSMLPNRKAQSAKEQHLFDFERDEFYRLDKNQDKNKNYINSAKEKMPKRSPERIEILTKNDPVFAKRYKLYVSAKTCKKAPKFDLNDYYIPKSLPKSTIVRKKHEIIREASTTQIQPPKIFKIEMEKVDAKVKRFVHEISDSFFL